MRSLLIILSQAEREGWAQELIAASQTQQPLLLVSSPAEAAQYIAQNGISPSHVVMDIGLRGRDVLAEIDELAKQCEPVHAWSLWVTPTISNSTAKLSHAACSIICPCLQ